MVYWAVLLLRFTKERNYHTMLICVQLDCLTCCVLWEMDGGIFSLYIRVCMRACVCVHACVRACMCACVRAIVFPLTVYCSPESTDCVSLLFLCQGLSEATPLTLSEPSPCILSDWWCYCNLKWDTNQKVEPIFAARSPFNSTAFFPYQNNIQYNVIWVFL